MFTSLTFNVRKRVADVCSLSIPGRHGGGLYPLAALAAPSAAPSAAPDFFLHNSPAALAAGRATGSSPTAGRRRGKPMGIGHLLAPDSEPAHWWLYPLARVARGRRGLRWIILRNAPAALAACRAKGRSPTVAAAAAR